MIILYFLSGALLFALAYRFYGRYLERKMGLSDDNVTPACRLEDGVDYIPTSDTVLFGHHFSSIAGAGPIVGPIVAGLAFGWLPAALWIVIGAIFVGGVHDYTAMAASIRNDGRSIGEICRTLLPRPIYMAFLVFIVFTLIYVIIVFLDLTASGFAPDSPTPESARQGGAVACSAVLYIFLALAFGFVVYRRRCSLLGASLIFVPLVFVAMYVGMRWPLLPEYLPTVGSSVKNFWIIILLVYCLLASVLPVWMLLQPRDYLSSFLLYACLIGGTVGLIIAGFQGEATIQYPAFIGWRDSHLGPMFPALFITIACGAVSGFHSIVASGTSAKQLRRESSARRIGYGGMLIEGLLALLALAAVMILSKKSGNNPVQIFADGLGVFIGALGFNADVASTFGMLAVSTFLLTTLDTCTRLARFVVQEFFGLQGNLRNRILITLGVLAIPAIVTFQNIHGPDGRLMPAWQAVWPAFGASNQLLAALALLCVFMWLRRSRLPTWFAGVPLVFMTVTTMVALRQLSWANLCGGSRFIGIFSLILLLLAVAILAGACLMLWRTRSATGHTRAET